jgi:predicted N-acetyltransferase YhbS
VVSEAAIRDARPGDAAAIRAVTLEAYGEYADQLGEHWEPYRRNIEATLADCGAAEQIVAERGGLIAGAVLLYPAGAALPAADAGAMAWPEVRLLAVASRERGRGIGDLLMRECIHRARASGASALTLHTTGMMRAAMRLYARLGFRADPALDFHPAPGLTINGYRLDLQR